MANETDQLGRVPVHFAAKYGFLEVIDILVEAGAKVNIPDNLGSLPLHYAVEEKASEVVQRLLDHGSDVKYINKFGKTPAEITYNKQLLGQMGTGAKSGKTVLDFLDDSQKAAALGHPTPLELLLNQDTKALEKTDTCGQTPLHWAAREGHSNIIKILLKKGAISNTQNKSGHTPLYLATRFNNHECVELLQDNLKETYEFGNSPLHVAAYHNCTNVAKTLINFNVDINATNIDKKTPLHLAVLNRHKNFAEILIQAGADPNLMDADEWSAMDYADGNFKLTTRIVPFICGSIS